MCSPDLPGQVGSRQHEYSRRGSYGLSSDAASTGYSLFELSTTIVRIDPTLPHASFGTSCLSLLISSVLFDTSTFVGDASTWQVVMGFELSSSVALPISTSRGLPRRKNI